MSKFTHPKDAPEGHKWQLNNGNGDEITSIKWFPEVTNSAYKIVAVINGVLETFTDDGMLIEAAGRGGEMIIDAPRTRTIWVNLYPSGVATTYSTKKHADAAATSDRIACQRVPLTEGVFDE